MYWHNQKFIYFFTLIKNFLDRKNGWKEKEAEERRS